MGDVEPVRGAPVGALSARGPSHAGPASTSQGHGHANKAANAKAKQLKNVRAHGRANRTRSNGHASKVTRARGAQQLHRAHSSRGALMHKKAQPKPKRLQLPGPIGEKPAPPPRQGKRKK